MSDLSCKDQGSRRCLLLLQGAALQQHAVAFIWAGLSCPALLLRSQETGLLFVPSALNGDERGYAHRQSLSDSQAYVGSKTNLTQSKGDRRKMKAKGPGFYALSVSCVCQRGAVSQQKQTVKFLLYFVLTVRKLTPLSQSLFQSSKTVLVLAQTRGYDFNSFLHVLTPKSNVIKN